MAAPKRPLCRLADLCARRGDGRRQAGSIAVLTLLAIGVIFGAFLYVAVLGSRVTEKTRVQTAADSTALAAATIKARTMNYAAFLFLSESVTLPLSQVAWFITAAQLSVNMPGICAVLLFVDLDEGINCVYHLVGTIITSKIKALDIASWLDVMEQTAAALNTIGPQWAELVALQTGTAESYRTATGAVDVAAAYPFPTAGRCTGLGLEMIDNEQPVQPEGLNACRAEAHWEQVYALMGLDVIYSPLDLLGWLFTDPVAGCGWLSEVGAPVAAGLCTLLLTNPAIIQLSVAVALSFDPIWGPIARQVVLNNLLVLGDVAVARGPDYAGSYLLSGELPCHAAQKVPALGASWKQHQRSVGLAMITVPSEAHMLERLGSLRTGNRGQPATSAPPGLLGVACAEHYSQDHEGQESLWHMDFRGRLVPCQLQSGAGDRALVEGCTVPGDFMAERFTWQMDHGMGQDFSH